MGTQLTDLNSSIPYDYERCVREADGHFLAARRCIFGAKALSEHAAINYPYPEEAVATASNHGPNKKLTLFCRWFANLKNFENCKLIAHLKIKQKGVRFNILGPESTPLTTEMDAICTFGMQAHFGIENLIKGFLLSQGAVREKLMGQHNLVRLFEFARNTGIWKTLPASTAWATQNQFEEFLKFVDEFAMGGRYIYEKKTGESFRLNVPSHWPQPTFINFGDGLLLRDWQTKVFEGVYEILLRLRDSSDSWLSASAHKEQTTDPLKSFQADALMKLVLDEREAAFNARVKAFIKREQAGDPTIPLPCSPYDQIESHPVLSILLKGATGGVSVEKCESFSFEQRLVTSQLLYFLHTRLGRKDVLIVGV